MQRIRKALNNQRGVTLIELLAVVVILGIVAAVAVPAVLNQINDSKTGVDETNLVMVRDAVERAYVSGDLTTTGDITFTPADPSDSTSAAASSPTTALGVIVPKYLKEIPALNNNSNYKITITAVTSGVDATITAVLE